MLSSGPELSDRSAVAPESGTRGETPVMLSRWSLLLRSLLHDPPALAGAVVVVVLLIVAVFGSLLAPHNPYTGFGNGLSKIGAPLPPGGRFPLGTDPNGRDVLSRLIFGARISLTIGVAANGIATLVGLLVGLVAGYIGGWVDTVLMRLTDVVMAFPILLFAIALIAVTGPSETNVILVIAFLYWTYVARVIHGMVLSLKEREFVTATRTLGISGRRIMFRHIVPHLVPALIVYFTLGVASTILIEASLSYIGIGVPVPIPSWGQMIAQGQDYYQIAPWLFIFPGIALVATVLAFNLVGDWLRDVLDPTTPQKR